MRTEMDCLVIENFLLEKSTQPPWRESADWRETLEAD
jgi:carbamoyltransferase